MSNAIEDIRARHQIDAGWCGWWSHDRKQQHDDRGTLLAEVDRLRAENARLRARVAEYFSEPDTHPIEDA